MNAFIQEAPPKGMMLAYFRDGLIFEPYEIREGALRFEGREADAVRERVSEASFRECHLFDADREWRFVRRAHGLEPVRLVLTREEEERMDPDLIYEEEVLVRPEYAADGSRPAVLRMINRYRYSASDTLTLDNYRIALKEARVPG